MRHPFALSLRPLAALAFVTLLGVRAASAQVAAPGDIYYSVRVVQKFQYYAFSSDVVPWEDFVDAGTSISGAAAHDTSEAAGTLGLSCSYAASAGLFTADFDTHMYMLARTGIFHLLTNQLTVDIYVRGSTGTPFWIRRTDDGQAQAWRLGGLPGTIQAVNGTSTATFCDTIATTSTGGTIAKVDTLDTLAPGFTGGQIVVNGETYSFARSFVLKAPAMMTQAVCVLGCMLEAADFGTETSGHVELETFPYVSPVAVTPAAPAGAAFMVRAAPNPLRSRSSISFRAPAGERAEVRVFDLAGRLLAELFDGPATGEAQSVAWQPAGSGAGLYFVQVRANGRSATARLARVE